MDVLKTGTTTVGIVAKDVVIMGADKRATAGGLVMDKNVTKVIPLNERMVVTISGVVSDIQLMVKYIRAEIKMKDLKTGLPTTVKEAANLLASFNYSGLRYQGSIAHFLLAGTDVAGPQLFQVSFDGAVMPVEDYDVTGSGTMFALGVLEGNFKRGMSEADGVALAKKALQAAMERDTGSGNGFDIFVVSKDGVQHKESVRLAYAPAAK